MLTPDLGRDQKRGKSIDRRGVEVVVLPSSFPHPPESLLAAVHEILENESGRTLTFFFFSSAFFRSSGDIFLSFSSS